LSNLIFRFQIHKFGFRILKAQIEKFIALTNIGGVARLVAGIVARIVDIIIDYINIIIN